VLPAVAPANGQIDIARGVGDVGQVIGAVMKQIAQARPKELCVRMFAGAQPGDGLGRVFALQDFHHFWRCFGLGHAVVATGQIQNMNVLADLAEDAAAGLLAQRALFDQGGQPLGGLEVAMPGIFRQRVGHGLDDVRHGIQADHVGGPIGGAFGPSEQRASQRVDLVESQAQTSRVVQGGQDREHADPVADEVRRVLRVHHALAQGSGEKSFQTFEHVRVSAATRNQFGQVHVARRVEEVHAAKPRPYRIGQRVGHGVDAQPGRIGSHHGVRCDVAGDLAVQIQFPVHPLGDRLDDQVAAVEQVQAGVVIGRHDGRCQRFARQGSGGQLAEIGDGAVGDAVRIAVLCGKIE